MWRTEGTECFLVFLRLGMRLNVWLQEFQQLQPDRSLVAKGSNI